MLDEFLKISAREAVSREAQEKLASTLRRLPTSELLEIMKTGQIKSAHESTQPTNSTGWLEQFKDTPLLQSAMELEHQEVINEAQRAQRYAADEELFREKDQLNLNKRLLEIELAKSQAAGLPGLTPVEAPPAEVASPAGPAVPTETQSAPTEGQKVGGVQRLRRIEESMAKSLASGKLNPLEKHLAHAQADLKVARRDGRLGGLADEFPLVRKKTAAAAPTSLLSRIGSVAAKNPAMVGGAVLGGAAGVARNAMSDDPTAGGMIAGGLGGAAAGGVLGGVGGGMATRMGRGQGFMDAAKGTMTSARRQAQVVAGTGSKSMHQAMKSGPAPYVAGQGPKLQADPAALAGRPTLEMPTPPPAVQAHLSAKAEPPSLDELVKQKSQGMMTRLGRQDAVNEMSAGVASPAAGAGKILMRA